MLYLIILNCMFLMAIITSFLKYRKTGLKCHLFTSLGGAIAFIGIIGMFGFMHIGNYLISDLFGIIFMLPGGVLGLVGFFLRYTVERDNVQESYRGHSVSDIMLGKVSPLEKDKK